MAIGELRVDRAPEQRIVDRAVVQARHRQEAVDIVHRLPRAGWRRAIEKVRLRQMLAAMLQRAHAGERNLLGAHELHAAGRRTELGQRDAIAEHELALELERNRAELDLLRRQRKARADDLLVGQRRELREPGGAGSRAHRAAAPASIFMRLIWRRPSSRSLVVALSSPAAAPRPTSAARAPPLRTRRQSAHGARAFRESGGGSGRSSAVHADLCR